MKSSLETANSKKKREEERLAKLLGYNISSSYDQSGSFQHVAAMAARIFNVPMAFVNFVDEENVLTKANIGLEGTHVVSRKIGLCSMAILKDEVTVFKDTQKIECLSENPFVHGGAGILFYAGAPIKTSDGFTIGIVGIADRKTREFSKENEKTLEGLATIVIDELEIRQRRISR